MPIDIPADDNRDIEYRVVTGTRSPTLLSNSPIKVDVIDKDAIARLSKGTLRQVLEVMPGVVVRRSQKDGYNVQLHGFNGDHVLVLINGQPIIAPTGSSVDLDQISVANIRQIEIVRGAASVLYGSSAMGGVINIITAKPVKNTATLDYEVGHYTDDGVSGDTLTHTTRINAAGKMRGWQAAVSAQHITNPGFDYDETSVAHDGGAVDKTFVKMALSTQFDSTDFAYQMQFFDEKKDRPQSAIPGQSSIISYQSDVEQWQHDFSVKQAGLWHVNSRYLAHDETSGNTNGLRETDIQLGEIDAQYQFQSNVLTMPVNWVSGLVLHADNLDQQNVETGVIEVDDVSRQSVEAYLQAQGQFKNTQLLAGVRIQNDSDFNWHTAAKLSANRKFKYNTLSIHLRGGVGSSYRVPNLKERYYVFDHSNLGYMVLGNAQLQPETALSSNVGASFNWSIPDTQWSLKTDIEFHYTDATDFIIALRDEDASKNAGLDISIYNNLDEAQLYGADLSVAVQNDNWTWQTNYSYLHTEDKESNRLPERPTHLIKTALTYQFSRSETSIQVYAVHENDVSPTAGYTQTSHDAYTTVNAVLQHQYNSAISMRIGAENISNEHRSPDAVSAGVFDARPISSRRVYVSVRYAF
ncbi:TonB-dependent receptor [Alteromonas sp. 345S023]|uniref:TonB-dependent receptor n=1 Tax=Alteromonas profundi TaxID=2696062 RepID=A0A7X5LNN9_9ALTE|nr:TonB-dependent receptor [Alteromonas profundi]NDV92682.1 TonB-dependent receptor [Alteromonas profundi]